MTPPKIEIPVHGGMCVIEFGFGWATGERGSDTSPGAFFRFIGYAPSTRVGDEYHNGEGVIARGDLATLRDAISEFLTQHPPLASDEPDISPELRDHPPRERVEAALDVAVKALREIKFHFRQEYIPETEGPALRAMVLAALDDIEELRR